MWTVILYWQSGIVFVNYTWLLPPRRGAQISGACSTWPLNFVLGAIYFLVWNWLHVSANSECPRLWLQTEPVDMIAFNKQFIWCLPSVSVSCMLYWVMLSVAWNYDMKWKYEKEMTRNQSGRGQSWGCIPLLLWRDWGIPRQNLVILPIFQLGKSWQNKY
jgi:hypothetical protein